MRVASRRLRSAIRDFSPYLRKSKMRRAKDDLKSLAAALGFVRDNDVAIMALDKLAEEAPSEVSLGVRQFADERRHRRDGARAQLERVLTEEALAKLQEDFKNALADGVKDGRRPEEGGEDQKETSTSFRRAGRGIILAGLAEFEQPLLNAARAATGRPARSAGSRTCLGGPVARRRASVSAPARARRPGTRPPRRD
jgi:CHAD domain-containing protein